MNQMTNIKSNTEETIQVSSLKADMIKKIIEYAPICNKIDYIYLFGSSLEERCSKQSDIDLAIISKDSLNKLVNSNNKGHNMFKDKLYSINIEQNYDFLYFKSLQELEQRQHKDLICKEILANGKIIYTREN